MPPFGRSERAFSLRADAWLPRPRAAQPSPNPPDTTPIPTEYKGFKSPGSGTLGMRWRRAVRPLQARQLKRRRTRTSEQHRQQSTTRSAMSDPGPEDRAALPLVGGRLLAEITNRIVAFMREHYGRGPIKAKTYVLDNLIVCVLTDGGFTAIERTMMEGHEPDRVLEMRRDFQRMMKERYSEMIEELTGRKVLAFLSQAHVEPDLTIEMFLMDGPLAGFGALELVDPPPGNPDNGDD